MPPNLDRIGVWIKVNLYSKGEEECRSTGRGYHVISNWREYQDEMPHLGREVLRLRGGDRRL